MDSVRQDLARDQVSDHDAFHFWLAARIRYNRILQGCRIYMLATIKAIPTA